MKTAIFYGSTTGVTEEISRKVANILHADIFPVSEISKVKEHDFIILASSTWGMGELQDDWIEGIENLKTENLTGKKVGFIGVGDQESFGDSFVDAIGIIYNEIKDQGIHLVGQTSTEGYSFRTSKGVIDGEFLGLIIDENNQSELTETRIKKWIEKVR